MGKKRKHGRQKGKEWGYGKMRRKWKAGKAEESWGEKERRLARESKSKQRE